LVDFLQGITHAIIALEKIDSCILSQLPELQVISKYGVGLDMIDMQAMQKYNVKLGWTGGVNRRSVSELVISFAIALLRHVPASYKEVLEGTWRQHVGGHLSGRTVGIIGCGYIGKDLVKMLQPFDCPILVNDIQMYDDFYKQYNIKVVEKEELLTNSDIVTLHVPLDDSTRNILSAEHLSLMKPDAILINIARGGLLDEDALKQMLMNGKLGGAALDVFAIEPPTDQELLELPNFLVTPHIGGSAYEAILAMGIAAIDGLDNNKIVV
jgi:D-3-phosphoglycerate dehydrogenase